MARKPRIHLPGGLYHVIFRGNGGQPVFFADADRWRFYLLLQEGTCRFRYRVHAFCLMPNHIHLALQAGDLPLAKGMHNLSFRYTRWVNRREDRTGHLFQGRYRAVLVDSEHYLLALVRYIHLNPVRARLVADPGKYRWSSHSAYLGGEELPWLITDEMLSRFGKTKARARSGYQEFLLNGLNEQKRQDFYGGEDDYRILGDEDFSSRCLVKRKKSRPQLSLEEIVDRVCRAYNLDLDSLRSPSQNRLCSEARAVVAWLGRERSNVMLADVAKTLQRDSSTLSSSLRRLDVRLQTGSGLQDCKLTTQLAILQA